MVAIIPSVSVYYFSSQAPIAGQKLTGKGSEPMFKDLIKDGSKIAVTPDRVQEYVR